tara:strand:- start:32156 stop:33406 length:1251 start_codon:yes stop_codon:yes gene_type:complete
MKLKITMIILLIGFNAIAQSTFKEGYFINNAGEKKEGFFMSFGKQIPDVIIFKESQNSLTTNQLEKAELSEIVIGDTKIVKKDVFIEYLDKNMVAKNENNTMIFNLTSQKLLLNVLLEFNDFTLYSWNNNDNEYFFIESKDGIELLKYKKITNNNITTGINDYKKQLLINFELSDSRNQGILGGVKYKESDFTNYFLSYAEQHNYPFEKYNPDNSRDFKDAINITPKLGYSFISQTTKTEDNSFETSFDESQISFGLDIELFFNAKFKKSSVILSYMHHNKIDKQGEFSFTQPNDSQVYNTLTMNDIQLKYRQYFKLTYNQYLYVNAGLLGHISKGGTEYAFTQTNAKFADLKYDNNQNNLTFSLGIGYNFNNIYFELNYIPKIKANYETLSNVSTSSGWQYERSVINLSLGYAIF